MLPKPINFSVYPAVVPADTPVELTILPMERAFLPVDGAVYQVTVISMHDDETDYYHPSRFRHLTIRAQGGMLRFTDTFPEEQQHLIRLSRGEEKLQDMMIYSLYPDLYALRPLKGDLHAHSYRSDGRRDPVALAGHYREQGYEFFALTDHNRLYPGREVLDGLAEVKTGILCLPGEEVHSPDSILHLVHVGGRESVTEQYVQHRQAYDLKIEEYKKRVPDTIPPQYRDRYAKAWWASDAARQAGGMLIFPHPFWYPLSSMVYNVRPDFAGLLLRSGLFDAYELIGGMFQMDNNRSVAFWNDLRADGVQIPAVASSDVHRIENSATFCHNFTLCFAQEWTHESILQAVKQGNCVAVEMTGEEEKRQYRCYGSLRLCSYAQFLLHHFYPEMTRICQGEGVALRAWAMGRADTALVEMQFLQTEKYRECFFGKAAPAIPFAAINAFEEKWRAVQMEGPTTRGSSLEIPPNSRQI